VISPCFPLHFVGLRASRRVAGGIGFAEAEKLFRFDVEVPRSEEVPGMDEMLQLRFTMHHITVLKITTIRYI